MKLDVAGMNKHLKGVVGKPFRWGQMDCNTLALRCLDILTGMKEPRFSLILENRYNSEAGAIAFARDYPITMERVLGMAGAVEAPDVKYCAGDFILVKHGDEPWDRCHVCVSDSFCVTVLPDKGVVVVPIRWIEKPHRVLRLKQCQEQ